jgi:hypothetical protein
MPITVTCKCGKRLRVADEHQGKRVRCPACREPVVAEPTQPAVASAPQPTRAAAKVQQRPTRPAQNARDPENTENDRQDRPSEPKTRSGATPWLLWIGAGCASLLLLGCAGMIGLVILLLGGRAVEDQLVGTWELDRDAAEEVNPAFLKDHTCFGYQLNKDGTYECVENNSRLTGKWRVDKDGRKPSAEGVTVLTTRGNSTTEFVEEYRILDANHLRIHRSRGDIIPLKRTDRPLAEAGDTGNQGKPSADPARQPTPAQVDFRLTSQQLAKDYEIDKVAAAAKYTGKWVEVEGPMESVLVLPSGDVNIRLVGFEADPKKFSGHSVRGIPAAADAEKLKSLTRGQMVKLKGKVERETAGMFVDLVPCELVSIGPDPAIRVTADQLTQDYARDAAAADRKYRDKWLLVEGTVAELKEDRAAADCVILEGAGKKDGKPLRVSAAYPADRKKDFAALKKGDRVKIKGECGGEFAGTISFSYTVLVK